jgi:hypothetical protein
MFIINVYIQCTGFLISWKGGIILSSVSQSISYDTQSYSHKLLSTVFVLKLKNPNQNISNEYSMDYSRQ